MNMATIKVLLRTSKLNDKGLAPLYLRLIKDRKAKFISLKIYLKPSEWNEESGKVRKSHPNSTRMNAMIAQRIADAEGVAVEMETKSKTISSHKMRLMKKLNIDNNANLIRYAILHKLFEK
jgi:DNA-binding CsgD family transcriptional regulator